MIGRSDARPGCRAGDAMPQFDTATLLLVTAVFNGFAALVWCLLGGLFRIAPAASLLLAGSHLLAMPALLHHLCPPARLLPVGLSELAGIGALTLLGVGVRRLLRLQRRLADLLLTALLGAAITLLLLGLARPPGAAAASALTLALLALLCWRDVLAGAAPGLPARSLALLSLPFAGLLLLCLAHGLSLLWWPAARALFVQDCRAGGPLAWLWLLVSMGIALALVTLVLRRLLARIEHLTLSDPLTGALNRRAIGQQLAALQAQLQRGSPFAVLMIDIDHFKRINDDLGHAAGDAALQHVVRELRAALREQDCLGRLGGEEFCALLPGTGAPAARQVAERMRERLQASDWLWQGRRLRLSASFGVAAGRADDAGDGTSALALADAGLYRAKAEGRNRVSTADPEGAS